MKRTLLIAALAISATGTFAQTTDPTPYCSPKFKNPAANTDYIDSVNINAGAFIKTSTIFNNSNYVYYNNLQPVVITEGANNVIFMHGYSTLNTSIVAWIDMNHDNVFDDVNEEMDSRTVTVSGGKWLSGLEFVVPATADTGLTRMRLVAYDYSNAVILDPCTTGLSNSSSPDYGEAEDYNVRIVDAATGVKTLSQSIPVTIFPNPAKDEVHVITPASVNSKLLSVTITDLMGREVSNQPMPANNAINVSHLAPSIYQLSLWNDGQLVSRTKLVMQ